MRGGCELGHIVIKHGGLPCTCGRKGCFESYASASALMASAREAAEKNKNHCLMCCVAETYQILMVKWFLKQKGQEIKLL